MGPPQLTLTFPDTGSIWNKAAELGGGSREGGEGCASPAWGVRDT